MEALELSNYGNQTGIFLLSDLQNIELTKSRHPAWNYRISDRVLNPLDQRVYCSKKQSEPVAMYIFYLCYCNLHKLSVGFLLLWRRIRTQFKKDTLWGQSSFRLFIVVLFADCVCLQNRMKCRHCVKKKLPIARKESTRSTKTNQGYAITLMYYSMLLSYY